MKRHLGSILMMAAFAAMSDPTTQREITRNTSPKIPLRSAVSFKEREGVLNTINDYKQIKLGNSKKGKLKQSRIISRVEEWIEQGLLTNEDLK